MTAAQHRSRPRAQDPPAPRYAWRELPLSVGFWFSLGHSSIVLGVFLQVMGIINLVVLIGIVEVFLAMRHGDDDEAELEARRRPHHPHLGRCADLLAGRQVEERWSQDLRSS